MKKSNILFSLAFGLALLINAPESNAATFYASPAGTGGGTSIADAAELQDAMDFASTGDSVVLVPGNYWPMSPILIGKEINVIGSGSTMYCSISSTCIQIDPYVERGLWIHDLHFEDFNIGIDIPEGAKPYLSNLVFDDPDLGMDRLATGIYIHGDKADPLIYEMYFYGDLGDGVYGIESDEASFTVTDSYFDYSNAGIRVSGSSARVRITSSDFYGTDNGIQIFGTSLLNIINGNSFTSPAGDIDDFGVWATGSSDVRIFGNTFSAAQGGVLVDDSLGAGSVEINNNTFDSGIYCIELRNDYTAGTVTQNNIHNNTLNNCGYGVWTRGAEEESTVDANYFDGNDYAVHTSFYESGTQTIFTNNLIQNSVIAAAAIEAADLIFAYNTIVNGLGDGVTVSYGDKSYIVNNIIVNNVGTGLLGDASSTLTRYGFNDAYGNATNFSTSGINMGGNVSVDPSFVSATDFHLQTTSALVHSAGLYFIARDIESTLRSVLHSEREIGAYEVL